MERKTFKRKKCCHALLFFALFGKSHTPRLLADIFSNLSKQVHSRNPYSSPAKADVTAVHGVEDAGHSQSPSLSIDSFKAESSFMSLEKRTGFEVPTSVLLFYIASSVIIMWGRGDIPNGPEGRRKMRVEEVEEDE